MTSHKIGKFESPAVAQNDAFAHTLPDIPSGTSSGTLARLGQQTRAVRPCGIATGAITAPGLIRHLSSTGAQIETALQLSVGDEVQYFWDGLPQLRARVAWQCEGLVGLRNLPHDGEAAMRTPRGLRVACRLPARADRGTDSFRVFVGNISQSGVLVYGMPGMEAGTRFDLTICGQRFSGAEVRWSRGGCVGVSFAQQVDYETIAALVELASFDEAGGGETRTTQYAVDMSGGTARPFDACAKKVATGGSCR